MAKLLKKKIKNETDPEKFIRLCDIWSKYFTGPAGHKQFGQILGKGHSGGKSPVHAAAQAALQVEAGR